MRHTNVQPIGDVIRDLLKQFRIDQKLQEVGIINAWDEILGIPISKVTSKIYVQRRILFVHLSSPAIRNEILMNKSKVIKALNEKVGASVIDDIVLR